MFSARFYYSFRYFIVAHKDNNVIECKTTKQEQMLAFV